MRCFGISSTLFAAVGVTLLLASRARAGGLEYSGAGAQSLGRGGAVTARADDPMVLQYNPAGLAELRGAQLLVDLNIPIMHACVDPIGFYGWGAYGGGSASRIVAANGSQLDLNLGDTNPGTKDQYYMNQLDTVCMQQRIQPVPQLGATWRVSERLGIGAGLMFPSALPQGQWGDANGVIQGAQGLRPAATRYMLINAGTVGIFPTVGFGFRLADWLRVGGSFEWGVVHADQTNMVVAAGGTTPNGDILSRVRATDWFVPAVNASLHLVPIDALDVVLAFRYQDDLHASGDLALTTNTFLPGGRPNTTKIPALDVTQKFPWKLRGGIRYASRFAPRPKGTGADETKLAGRGEGRIHDAMEDERWDIEFDLEYQANSRNLEQSARFPTMGYHVLFVNDSGASTPANFPQATRPGGSLDTVIPKHWKDTFSARLGGTYNMFPGLFSISLGAHYENRGIDPAYMQIDYWPVSRYGIHAGIKIRVARTIDLVASYAHIFQETLIVGAPKGDTGDAISTRFYATGILDAIDKHVGVQAGRGAPETPEAIEPTPVRKPDGTAALSQTTTQASQGRPPYIINSGTYRSGIDVVAIGANIHF